MEAWWQSTRGKTKNNGWELEQGLPGWMWSIKVHRTRRGASKTEMISLQDQSLSSLKGCGNRGRVFKTCQRYVNTIDQQDSKLLLRLISLLFFYMQVLTDLGFLTMGFFLPRMEKKNLFLSLLLCYSLLRAALGPLLLLPLSRHVFLEWDLWLLPDVPLWLQLWPLGCHYPSLFLRAADDPTWIWQ